MNNDLISRNYVEKIIESGVVDLKDGTEEWRSFVNETCYDILNKVHNAPTIEPKWIPVSEKLPKFGETVLCQCQAKIYEVLKYTSCGWYHDDAHCYMEGFVIAWMDLPEPYVKEGDV